MLHITRKEKRDKEVEALLSEITERGILLGYILSLHLGAQGLLSLIYKDLPEYEFQFTMFYNISIKYRVNHNNIRCLDSQHATHRISLENRDYCWNLYSAKSRYTGYNRA